MKKLLIVCSLVLVAMTGCKKEQEINFNPLKPHLAPASTFNPSINSSMSSATFTLATLRATLVFHLDNSSELIKKYGTLTSISVTTAPTFSHCQNSQKSGTWYGGAFIGGSYNTSTLNFTAVYQFSSLAQYNKANGAVCRKLWGGVCTIVGSKTTGSCRMQPIKF